MPETTEELTPRQIVEELDKYIVGQKSAKRAVAVALRNRYRRRLLPDDLKDEVIPKNILMIGPTGVGKTEIARRLATLARAPFVKVEATKFTEVGYVGRDVDSMIRDLIQAAIRMVEKEKIEEVKEEAEKRAVERILDILQPLKPQRFERKKDPQDAADITATIRQMMGPLFGETVKAEPVEAAPEPAVQSETETEEERKDVARRERIRSRLRDQLISGVRDADKIDVSVEEPSGMMFMQNMQGGPEDGGGMDMQNMFGSMLPRRTKQRHVTVAEAKKIFEQEEAERLIDRDSVTREAIHRAEQNGIIFIDEIDKIAGAGRSGSGGGPDVSREGVQRDILPIIEGSTVNTKQGPVKTDHILFIAAGAFHVSRPSDLIPELQGRLPIRVELENLTEADFRRILTEPRNALTRQYVSLMETEGVTIEFMDDAIDELARIAADVNRKSENIGARRLHTILERLLEEVSFEAPEMNGVSIQINAGFVKSRLDGIVQDEDLSRYIL
jgi:ATP-dependent HslUV protease ATP-binding subunit HslU